MCALLFEGGARLPHLSTRLNTICRNQQEASGNRNLSKRYPVSHNNRYLVQTMGYSYLEKGEMDSVELQYICCATHLSFIFLESEISFWSLGYLRGAETGGFFLETDQCD